MVYEDYLNMMSSIYQLIIEEENNATEHLFYNAVGGKDKCLKFSIFLINRNKEKVNDKCISLKTYLTYEDGRYVTNQNILEVINESKLVIDSSPAYIRFRINEVSSHHQGNRFRIMVTPTEFSVPMLLNPAFCAPIEVKSKPIRPRESLDTSNETQIFFNKKPNSVVQNTADGVLNNAKLSRSGSGRSTVSNDETRIESLRNNIANVLPLVRTIKDSLSMHQIQQKDISPSVSFPVLCRLSQNASVFYNDMSMLSDLLQHDRDSQRTRTPSQDTKSALLNSSIFSHSFVNGSVEMGLEK